MIDFFEYLCEVRYAVLPHKKLVKLGHRDPLSSEKRGAYINLDIAKIKHASQMSDTELANFESSLNNKTFAYGKIVCGKTVDGISTKLLATADKEVNQEIAEKGRLIKVNKIASSKFTSIGLPANTILHEILAVQQGNIHFYTIEVVFKTLFKLASYDVRSEPRNKPTARGKLNLGKIIGEIVYGKNKHPLYDKISIIPA